MAMERSAAPTDEDVRWGRVAGLRPVVSPRTPLVFGVIAAVVLSVVVLLLIHLPGPLDEKTLADQRNGLVADAPVLPATVAGVDFGGRTVVLLFQRTVPDEADVQRWRSGLPDDLEIRVVVQEPAAQNPDQVAGVPVVVDVAQMLAMAVALPAARDGGPGVGYAVVDAGRVTRYSTLDPSWAGNAFEVATLVGATR